MSLSPEKLQEVAASYSKAWSSGSAEAVASHYAPDGQITINRGDPIKGQAAVIEMVKGFKTEFPDLALQCDFQRLAGNHAIFVWTLEGHHVETKKFVKVGGWEEWELDENYKVTVSLGWFDAVEYERQIAEGV